MRVACPSRRAWDGCRLCVAEKTNFPWRRTPTPPSQGRTYCASRRKRIFLEAEEEEGAGRSLPLSHQFSSQSHASLGSMTLLYPAQPAKRPFIGNIHCLIDIAHTMAHTDLTDTALGRHILATFHITCRTPCCIMEVPSSKFDPCVPRGP